MTTSIGIVHRDPGSAYGVSFPDALGPWCDGGGTLPSVPRDLDAIRGDAERSDSAASAELFIAVKRW